MSRFTNIPYDETTGKIAAWWLDRQAEDEQRAMEESEAWFEQQQAKRRVKIAVSPRPQAQQGRGESRGHAAQQQRTKSSGDGDDDGDSDADPADPRRIIPPIPDQIHGKAKSVKKLCIQRLGRDEFSQEFYAGYYQAVADGKTYTEALKAARAHVYKKAGFSTKEKEKNEKTVAALAHWEDTRPRLGFGDPAEYDEKSLDSFDNKLIDDLLLQYTPNYTHEEREALRATVHDSAGPRRLAEMQQAADGEAVGQMDLFTAPAMRWPSLPETESGFSRWLARKTDEIRAAAETMSRSGDNGEVLA